MSISRAIALTDINNLLVDHPGYVVNRWYTPVITGHVTGGNASGTGNLVIVPGRLRQLITLSALGVRISTANAGNVQAAIYAHDPATGKPTGTALASTASMSTASAAAVNAAVSIQLSPSLYWWAINIDNATAALTSMSIISLGMSQQIGSATQANLTTGAAGLNAYYVAQTFGTWPDLTSASFTELNTANWAPVVQFKVASVP